MSEETKQTATNSSLMMRILNSIEKIGNKLPDPAVLFFVLMIVVWLLSMFLSNMTFSEIDPRNGQPIVINNQLTGTSIASFLSNMVTTFTSFHPLGVVLVALLGVGVAEHTGFINASLKALLNFTPAKVLTPMLVLVGVMSNIAADAGYVLVIPLGAVIFYTAGRHPLAGIAATFAGVSGGFSANFIPNSLDPLISGLTQQAAQIIDPARAVNPLSNWFFMSASCVLIVAVGWYVTDRIIEPRLKGVEVDGDASDMPKMESLGANEKRGLWAGVITLLLGLIILAAVSIPQSSPMRSPVSYSLTKESFEKLGKTEIDREVLKKAETIKDREIFGKKGFEDALKAAKFSDEEMKTYAAAVAASSVQVSPQLTSFSSPSASAKWALLAPIFVPMLMQLGISPELAQAAYRVSDSTTNIITPLMPYFPLVVVFAQKYVKDTGIGTVVSLMLPYSIAFFVTWVIFLIIYWLLGIPLGLQAPYTYP